MNVMRAQFAVLYLFLCSIASAERCVPFQNCKDGRITSAWNESSLVSFAKSDSSFRMQVVWKRKTPAIYSASNRIPDGCGHEYSGKLAWFEFLKLNEWLGLCIIHIALCDAPACVLACESLSWLRENYVTD